MEALLLIFSIFTLAFYTLFVLWMIKTLVFALPAFWGAPFVPSKEKDMNKMLELLDLKPGQTFYDLGSGDARFLIRAVKHYGVKKAIGIEINPFLVHYSRKKIKKQGLEDRIEIKRANLFKLNYSDADAMSMYLLQRVMHRLGTKLLNELRPGTPLASLSFTFDNIPQINADPEKANIRLYQIPKST